MGLLKYGLDWGKRSALDIERQIIVDGGHVTIKGQKYGEGLYHHYRAGQTLLWPDDDHHRWSDLGLKRICENEITVMMGCADANKTYCAARFILWDWWCFCDNTLWLISSTELRGAELRIWGKIKELFNRARERWPELPGTVLESKHCISTEEISEDQSEARLLTKGLIFIPCKQGGQWIGMGAYAGIKPTKDGRLAHCGDEVSVMERVFLDAYSNWYGKENFRGVMMGNPHDLEDPLCVAGEPIDGWDTWHDTEKTQEWRSKFYNAWVIAFDGRDSPNYDYPQDQKPRFNYLVGKKKLDAVAETHGRDSWQWYNQCIGKPRPYAVGRRVITKMLCDRHKAFDDVIWQGTDIIRIGAMDAAYGGVGGDRCVGGHIEMGKDVEGRQVIAVKPPVIVPVSVRNDEPAEEQIANWAKRYCEANDIPPQNFFFDGRGTLAVAIARYWSSEVNVVDFGGPATSRFVSMDEFIWEGNTETRRLKLCNEHYAKFVTELWFAIYYLVISEQVRRLPKDVAREGYQREWKPVAGNRIDVEPKADMKKRTGQSPDLFDWLVTAVEGARRLGFVIEKLKGANDSKPESDAWLERELRAHKKFVRKHELNYS